MLKNQSQYNFYLASTSPRRIEILSLILGIKQEGKETKESTGFELIKPDFDEDLDKSKHTAQNYVDSTALHKFHSISTSQLPCNSIVISADTIISSSKDEIIEKPKNKQEQFSNIVSYINEAAETTTCETLSVITSVVVYDKSRDVIHQFSETTDIIFDKDITKDIVQDYVDSEDGLFAAGGFKIQSLGGVLIKEIRGDYYNVVGLPLNSTFKVLKGIVDR